ncbi:hypothetical protein FFM54_26825 [Burkholderia pseudomallei]|nr:hypothetical protein FE789_10005 [Burkholderia pseudomallei]QCU52980.1 hypothetical protein FFM54_26825 [Burkholderia pseudomallei]
MPRHTSADTAGYRREDTSARVACIGIAGAAATCGGARSSGRARTFERRRSPRRDGTIAPSA